MKSIFLALMALALLTLQSRSMTHRVAAASLPPAGRSHVMPCPAGVTPDALHISWSVNRSGPEPGPMRGRRTVHRPSTVRQIYARICRLTLVSYARAGKTGCPGAPLSGGGVYHLLFTRATRKLLRVTERSAGCASLSVDGRASLGTASLGQGLILPAGIPR
jgi:hypothetical protein